MNLTALAQSAREIAREAGTAILEIYRDETNFQIEQKADASPLTLADRVSNRIICESLEKTAPDIPIVSEENKAAPHAVRSRYDYFWLVDPLDGTKEFIRRNGEFTVNIALVRRDRPVLGVVYAPCFDELYWAAEGAGAHKAVNGNVSRISAAAFHMEDAGLKMVCSRSHLNDETRAFIERFRAPELVSRGSSLKFLLLAQGEAHIYPRLGPTMEWDTGAAQIILEEAGGAVVDEETQQPLRYNKESLLNPHFVAFGKRI